jgi:tRNA-specific 2-thiouridylase
MDDFADSYLAGHTPIPCVRCNQTVKFKDLLTTAKELGADCLATGHYVQRQLLDGHACLRRGIDQQKDQSYFLFATTPEQLDYLRFPLGAMTKDATRELAIKYKLSVSDKPDSQDICFVPNGRYGDVVRRLRPGAITPGVIRHLDGRILGKHLGVIDYTIGQRRGLGIGGRKDEGEDNTPLYVVAIDADAHEVIVGPQHALACRDVYLDEVNWLVPSLMDKRDENAQGIEVFVKLRNTAPASPAKLFLNSDSSAYLVLEKAEYGIATGQAGVIYDGSDASLMLGGGWISSAPISAALAV